jgi:hypothetical protein
MTAAPARTPYLPRVPTIDEVDAAADAWGFNCGPAALCATTGLTPEQVRPHLGDDWPGYTNPTRLAKALRSAGHRFAEVYRGDAPMESEPSGIRLRDAILFYREHGARAFYEKPVSGFWLTRIQWGGPWTREGVPMRARYRQTHWIAESHDDDGQPIVYDVNAYTIGGWISRTRWADLLVPWLLREVVPRADGRWWPTHVWEVVR